MDSLDLIDSRNSSKNIPVQGHILSIGGDALNKLHDEEANNTKTKRKCATVRPTHFHGGVPSLMEKIPNHFRK